MWPYALHLVLIILLVHLNVSFQGKISSMFSHYRQLSGSSIASSASSSASSSQTNLTTFGMTNQVSRSLHSFFDALPQNCMTGNVYLLALLRLLFRVCSWHTRKRFCHWLKNVLGTVTLTAKSVFATCPFFRIYVSLLTNFLPYFFSNLTLKFGLENFLNLFFCRFVRSQLLLLR
jgi:hypothetical protein